MAARPSSTTNQLWRQPPHAAAPPPALPAPRRRDSKWANSALVAAVQPPDWAHLLPTHGPLAGMELQRQYEREAAARGGGAFVAPAQRVSDFVAGRAPRGALPPSSYRCAPSAWLHPGCAALHWACLLHTGLACKAGKQALALTAPPRHPCLLTLTRRLGVRAAPLHDFYPPRMQAAFLAALARFERQLPGFAGCAGACGGAGLAVAGLLSRRVLAGAAVRGSHALTRPCTWAWPASAGTGRCCTRPRRAPARRCASTAPSTAWRA